MTSITIPDSVTSIGKEAFRNCYKLLEVWNYSSLPISRGSLGGGYVGYYAKYIYTANEKSKQTKTNDEYIFYEEGVESYLLGYVGTSTELVLPERSPTGNNYDVYQYAFAGFSQLASVTIPKSVTLIGDLAFWNCSKLQNVIWNAENCTKAGAFNTSFDDHTIFNGCTNLKNVTFGEKVKTLPDYAFYGCRGLTSIIIPDSVTSIGEGAFEGCRGLTSVTIPDGVTSIGNGSFEGCSGLTEITIPFVGNSFDKTYLGYIFGSKNAIPASLKKVTITGGTSIGEEAFSGCSGLTSIDIPDSVTTIGESAFEGCSGLTSIDIPDSVTTIGESAFEGCDGLTNIVWNAKNCITVGSISSPLFDGCTNLSSLTFGDNVKRIPISMFLGCSGLTIIKVGERNQTFHAQRNCLIETKSKTLILGCKTSKIPDDGSVTSIGQDVFNRIRDTAKNQKILLKQSLSRA